MPDAPEPLLLHLLRYRFGPDATLGRLSVGPVHFGWVCEDEDRGLEARMTDEQIAAIKVRDETAIPIGVYRVSSTYSPKYAEAMRSYGRTDGKMPLLHNVPGFRGIRIHSGNDESHTSGCLLPGLDVDERGMRVLRSRDACRALYDAIWQAEDEGREVWIAITRDRNAWGR
jgi:hypothetical protein